MRGWWGPFQIDYPISWRMNWNFKRMHFSSTKCKVLLVVRQNLKELVNISSNLPTLWIAFFLTYLGHAEYSFSSFILSVGHNSISKRIWLNSNWIGKWLHFGHMHEFTTYPKSRAICGKMKRWGRLSFSLVIFYFLFIIRQTWIYHVMWCCSVTQKKRGVLAVNLRCNPM